MNKLTNKYGTWALITGASSGIGSEFAKQLGARGFNLFLSARNKEKLNQISEELKEQYHIETHVIVADLSKEDEIDKIISGCKNFDIGLLINNAGMETYGSFTKNSIDAETNMLKVNILSLVKLTHHFSSLFEKRGQSGIILLSSTFGYQPIPYFSSYAASKAFVMNFGEALNYELKNQGVDVLVLSPGLTDTPMAQRVGGDLDFNKMGMRKADVSKVVHFALKKLGKKQFAIPGVMNKIMSFFGSRILSRKAAVLIFGKMIKNSFNSKNI